MKIKHPIFHLFRNFLLILVIGVCFNISSAVAQRSKARQNPPDKSADVSYLADSTLLTRGDYLARLQRVFEAINKVKVTTASFYKTPAISKYLTQDEAAIALIKERLTQNDRTLNLQNVQMYQTLLDELESSNVECLADLDDYEKKLNEVKTGILTLRKDTVLVKIFTVDSLRRIFRPQLLELKGKKVEMDSLIKSNTNLINTLQARTSANIINVKELQYTTDNQLKAVGIKAFGKERRYLWETVNQKANGSMGFRRFMKSEQEISRYYFVYTRSGRAGLILLGAVFFFWVFFNFKSLINRDRLDAVESFKFLFIRPKPYQVSLIFILTLAPVFDLLAPALYIEGVHVALALSLTTLLYKRLPRRVFYQWCIFVVLLIAPVVLRLLGMPPRYQRWNLVIFSMASTAFALLSFIKLRNQAGRYRIFLPVAVIFIVFNLLSILCNLFGRFTLTQIFYTTASSAFLHAVSLVILVGMITEAFLLQIKSSRIRKHYPEYFDWEPVVKSIRGLLNIIAFFIWLSLFLVNLNIFNELYDSLLTVLTEKRTIGTLAFTFGGILLFLLIIWTANFLQKYIAYFFGDTGDDTLDDNKGERSKLIVTRLILLIGGFLLAVAASGLPIDKITVVLGALGVGIGLGLQNIVSNFVSGIILIFDKTLRIGDVVELSDKKGRVKEIGIRASTLLTDEGAEIIIPNGNILSNNIINWTLTNNQMRITISFTLAKPFLRQDVEDIIKSAVTSNDNILQNKEARIIMAPASKTSINVTVYFWCKDISMSESTRSTVNAMIYDDLEEKGIDVL
ncbi:mechanosensitive ion channel [Pedobacter sp. MC2016-15]|uniref:mechanosensitive ion channel family protein n=1 Tax=Pedobacter sp. MC2016-15 TaxID=2994473 RepID=UPI002245F58A|nr:mechanosensitive ion channel domain-containing protein [Pedobacter sp. MC2016-15]MCX2477609.1 mechanosensitive ion channel [Pedobacter sp. MC2016-15]